MPFMSKLRSLSKVTQSVCRSLLHVRKSGLVRSSLASPRPLATFSIVIVGTRRRGDSRTRRLFEDAVGKSFFGGGIAEELLLMRL